MQIINKLYKFLYIKIKAKYTIINKKFFKIL